MTEYKAFNQGTSYDCFRQLGAHKEKDRWHFAVWAPLAQKVEVVGLFNDWDQGFSMNPVGNSGVWETSVPGAEAGMLYKYRIRTFAGELLYKADPVAFSAEKRPGTASKLTELSYEWGDDFWMRHRGDISHFKRPMNIYEVHLGSWKQHGCRKEDPDFYSYRELAEELTSYVLKMHYTHVEILPVMEHPFDGSWGYQTTGYFAPTSRYGTPCDFKYLIDRLHQAGIGVILDWVPGHFCRDAHGLCRFSGSMLYESEEHLEWGTYKFDFGRPEVRSFLISSAVFWLEEYHADGIRVDGVSSMLYLNYGVGDSGRKRFNIYGGEENLDAKSFLQQLNETVGHLFPHVFMIAEESTAWPLVTYPPAQGGLGFHYKWDMGWMNDTLRYCQTDFPYRSGNHQLLTFSMMYAFNENFILPLSHDEVVHGKCSLIGRMPGDYWRKFAGLRLLLLYQMCHSGAKLNFMGNELGQFIEWRYYESLEWFLLDYEAHEKHQGFVQAVNRLYKEQPSLWEIDHDWTGYQWIDADNNDQGILIFKRQAEDPDDFTVILLNFQPDTYENYKIGVPVPGTYREIFNSDETRFGGSGHINPVPLKTQKGPYHGQEQYLQVTVPPIGGIVLAPCFAEKQST